MTTWMFCVGIVLCVGRADERRRPGSTQRVQTKAHGRIAKGRGQEQIRLSHLDLSKRICSPSHRSESGVPCGGFSVQGQIS